jgi:hypothetical protein
MTIIGYNQYCRNKMDPDNAMDVIKGATCFELTYLYYKERKEINYCYATRVPFAFIQMS